ncbi:MAG: response regulator [Acidobacteria bacterium]|nr:response regulator [Acidobacteriota bacterium]
MHAETVRRVNIPLENFSRPARMTVLLVIGDADLRLGAARALEAAGFDVLTAAHSGHALLAAFSAGHIDILAADLSMDDLSGPTLAARLRRHHPALQTLFVAKAGTPECEGLIVRPFTRDDLLEAVSRTLSTCQAC